jgi:hypothetical protein
LHLKYNVHGLPKQLCVFSLVCGDDFLIACIDICVMHISPVAADGGNRVGRISRRKTSPKHGNAGDGISHLWVHSPTIEPVVHTMVGGGGPFHLMPVAL